MFGLHRALVAQRNELKAVTAALSDVKFGFDPAMRNLDRLPFSLIEIQTVGTEVRTFAQVEVVALETITIAVTKDTVTEVDPIVNAIVSLAGARWFPKVSRGAAGYLPCRIASAFTCGEPRFSTAASAVMGARDVVLRWKIRASWEPA